MRDGDLLILKGDEVLGLLKGRELEIIQAVAAAYVAHLRGQSALPHSTFLRFPADDRNRIIALPAYLGEAFQVAGIKWIASFPGNYALGLDRASAVVVLNSMESGIPQAFIEGSVISAKRTAASAALAARTLHEPTGASSIGLIGCGRINFEIVRFLAAVFPAINDLIIYDLDAERASQFKAHCRTHFEKIGIRIAGSLDEVLGSSSLISLATTAGTPYITDASRCAPGTTILHISLRDFSPEVVLACDNIVDDVDHVCRAQTSVHLAEQLTGNRDFIRCTLADILLDHSPVNRDQQSLKLFSPFGLGVLDLAISKLVCELALQSGSGTIIESFLPAHWTETT